MNAFYASVARVLEVDEVGPTTDFRQTPGWCSLHGFGLLVLLENDWATPLDIPRFLELKTAGDLYFEAVRSLAAEVFKVPRDRLSAATAYASIPEWDSIAHLRLVMAAEQRFGTHYPLERIPELKTLADFLV